MIRQLIYRIQQQHKINNTSERINKQINKQLTQVPPHLASSITATFLPNSAALLALAKPPDPPPITK